MAFRFGPLMIFIRDWCYGIKTGDPLYRWGILWNDRGPFWTTRAPGENIFAE